MSNMAGGVYVIQLDLFSEPPAVENSSPAEPHIPEDDSPFCSSCKAFTPKILPIGKTGGWVGKAGDCSVHGIQVDDIARCPAFIWVSDEAREKFQAYLNRIGRGSCQEQSK